MKFTDIIVENSSVKEAKLYAPAKKHTQIQIPELQFKINQHTMLLKIVLL